MITRISKENADRYTLLFNKASEALGLTGDDKILSLNSYFANLNVLKTGGRKTENETDEEFNKRKSLEQQQKIFLRLPLDEDIFEINANTRTISIPADFSRNGVSVQSDELSEILYFVIDRYYDTADLASNDVNIAIQWQTRNAQGQTIEGVTKNYGKDIESIPGKIIFGWPISSQLTAAAGNISFAIRFYTIQDNQLVYSFSTIPATVAVKASLAYDLVNSANYTAIDYADTILNRITSNGIYDLGAPIPTAPVATALMILGELDLDNQISLPENLDEEFLLAVKAKPTDTSALSAKWKYYPAENTNIVSSVDGIDLTGDIDYELVTDYDASAELDYYVKVDDEYHKVIVDGEDNYAYVENSSPARFARAEAGSEEVELYVKRYICNINTASTGAGEYTVSFDASNGLNTLNFSLNDLVQNGATITVPGPEVPEFEDDQPSNNTILENYQASVKINVSESKDRLTYNWYVASNIAGPYTEITGMESSKISVKIVPAADVSRSDTETKDNQKAAYVIQNGENVVLYHNGSLNTIESTESGRGAHQWVALDLNLHVDDITNYKWGDDALTAQDVADAEANGLGAGHIVWWSAYDNLTSGRDIVIKDAEDNEYATLHVTVSEEAPVDVAYDLNEVGDELHIYNAKTLDKYYKVKAVSHRNKASEENSYESFRVTNSPVKPNIFYKGYRNGNEIYISESEWEKRGYRVQMGSSTILSVAVKSSIQTDGLACMWLKSKLSRSDPEYDTKVESYIHDLPNELAESLGNIFAGREYAFDSDNLDDSIKTSFIQITGDNFIEGAGLDTSNNAKYLEASIDLNQLGISDIPGAYYCVVVNKLNEHYTTAIGPMIRVEG